MDETDLVVYPLGRGPMARLTDGTPFFQTSLFQLVRKADPALPFVRLGLGVVDERVVVNLFTIQRTADGRAVAAADYRWWNFDKCVQVVVKAASVISYVETSSAVGEVPPVEERLRVEEQAGSKWAIRRTVDDELLKKVAQVARENPKRPTLAVAEQFVTAHRNASRWLAAARERGFLTEED